jgi:hypothetical protein
MILLDALSISLAAIALYQVNELRKQTTDRLTRLETRQHGKVEVKSVPVQPKQIFEKPIVPGAKEVKPLPIGGGKQVLDYETQVAEWI